jgi:general secretion pathway protein E
MSTSQPDGVVELVSGLIERAIAARASDVHFEPGETRLIVRFRVDALLHTVEELPAAIGPNIVARLKVLAGLLTYRSGIPQEGVIAAGAGGYGRDIRVATFPTVRGERAVLRLMASVERPLALDELGFSSALLTPLRQLVASPQGLLVVCGPAGSGKTTTLFALLAHLLRERPGSSILSVEDPAEMRLPGLTQVEIAPARGFTYAVALRSLLRQDPQVIMVGEVRDGETAGIVVEAALTGHLLLTTMHSGSPAEAIVRLREMGIPAYQVTSTLNGILAQRLLRTICAACGTSAGGEPACPQCVGTGYSGRTAVGHLVGMTPDLRRAVLDERDASELTRLCAHTGSLRTDAERLVADGRTRVEELRRVLGE